MNDHPRYAFLRVGNPNYRGDRSRETLVAYDAIVAMIPEPSDDGVSLGGTILRTVDGKQIRVPGETPEQIVYRMLAALHDHDTDSAPPTPAPSVPSPVTPVRAPSPVTAAPLSTVGPSVPAAAPYDPASDL